MFWVALTLGRSNFCSLVESTSQTLEDGRNALAAGDTGAFEAAGETRENATCAFHVCSCWWCVCGVGLTLLDSLDE